MEEKKRGKSASTRRRGGFRTAKNLGGKKKKGMLFVQREGRTVTGCQKRKRGGRHEVIRHNSSTGKSKSQGLIAKNRGALFPPGKGKLNSNFTLTQGEREKGKISLLL